MKFMNMKRFGSIAMAGALALSLAVPAFASNSTNITGTYRAITLAVTVPTTGQAIINPYGLPYELSEGGPSISGQQITTGAPLLIANRSAVSLSVSATALGQEKGTFKFNAADPNTANPVVTTKAGFVKMQMFAADGVTEANADDADALNTKFAALGADSDDPSKDLVVGTASSTMADIITLKKANADGELQDGGAAFFRLSGTVVKTPKAANGTDDDPWTSTDGFAVKLAFTFEPTEDPTVCAGTIALNDSTLDATFTSSTTATLTLGSGVPTDLTWTWTSSDTTQATVAVTGSDSKVATVTRVAAGSGVTVTATATGTDGTVYSATSGSIAVS